MGVIIILEITAITTVLVSPGLSGECEGPRGRFCSLNKTFTLFTNGRLPQTYLRYIERGIREKFDLGATPMKLRVRIGGK